MSNRDTLLPIDAFTVGLRDDQLRGLVERHAVRFEVGPQQVVKGGDTLARNGWVLELFGSKSSSDNKLKSSEATDHVWEVLRVIARAVVPDDEGPIVIDIEPFSGRVVIDPKRDYREEVPLRMTIQLETTARMSMVGEDDSAITDRIADRLVSLGARRK